MYVQKALMVQGSGTVVNALVVQPELLIHPQCEPSGSSARTLSAARAYVAIALDPASTTFDWTTTRTRHTARFESCAMV